MKQSKIKPKSSEESKEELKEYNYDSHDEKDIKEEKETKGQRSLSFFGSYRDRAWSQHESEFHSSYMQMGHVNEAKDYDEKEKKSLVLFNSMVVKSKISFNNIETEKRRKHREKCKYVDKAQSSSIPASRFYKYPSEVRIEVLIRKIENRVKKGKKSGKKFDTPWGTVTITPQKIGENPIQFMVSTCKDNYPGTRNKKGQSWKKYETWAKMLNKSSSRAAIARDLLTAIKHHTICARELIEHKGSSYSSEERRAAASLYATVMIAEEYRVDGNRELAIKCLEKIAEGSESFLSIFTGDAPGYIASAEDGTEVLRQVGGDFWTLPSPSQARVFNDDPEQIKRQRRYSF